MDIEILSAGEITKGMYIVAYESTETRHDNDPITGAFRTQNIQLLYPWFKGVPYEVLSRAGPIIMVRSAEQKPTVPSVCFFDSRMAKFFQIDKEYFDLYIDFMKRSA